MNEDRREDRREDSQERQELYDNITKGKWYFGMRMLPK